MKYILVYDVPGYPEEGGGTEYEEFETSEQLDKRVEQIILDGSELVIAGELFREYKYKAVEKVTKVVRE